jgi:hypothetical protein
MKYKANITDADVDVTAKTLEAGIVVPVANFEELCREFRYQLLPEQNGCTPSLSESKRRLLKTVVKYPMRSSSEYIKLAGISPNTLAKLRTEFVNEGLIREHIVSNNHGRPSHRWQPLDLAKTLVEKMKD